MCMRRQWRRVAAVALWGLALVAALSMAGPTGRIGKVLVLADDGRVEVPAKVCLTSGILDYLCVAPASGKEYESLLRLECRPSSLHAALLALGARPGRIDPKFKSAEHEAGNPDLDGRPLGDHVSISVRWGEGEDAQTVPVTDWLIDRATGAPATPLTWVFTGSFIAPSPDGKGKQYMADTERLVAAVLYHGACVLNLAHNAGNPYTGPKQGYEVNTQAVLPLESDVTVIFQFIKKDPADAPE